VRIRDAVRFYVRHGLLYVWTHIECFLFTNVVIPCSLKSTRDDMTKLYVNILKRRAEKLVNEISEYENKEHAFKNGVRS